MQNQLPSTFIAKLLNMGIKIPIYISWKEEEYLLIICPQNLRVDIIYSSLLRNKCK